MSTLVETKRTGDFLRWENPSGYSRDLKTALSGQNLKRGQVVMVDIAGKLKAITAKGNEVHTYDPNAAPSSGTFTLTLWHKNGYWVTTAAIAYDATNTAIATAVNAVLGTSAVSCAGTAATTIALTFSGTGYASLSQPLGTLDFSNLIGVSSYTVVRTTSAGYTGKVWTVAIAGTLSGGTYRLGLPLPNGGYVWTDTIAYNASIANVQTAIDDVTGGTNLIVAGGTAQTAMTLACTGTNYAGVAVAAPQVDTAACTGATGVTITPNGALAILTMDADASAADVSNVQCIVRDAIVNGDELLWNGCDPVLGAAELMLVGIKVVFENNLRTVAM